MLKSKKTKILLLFVIVAVSIAIGGSLALLVRTVSGSKKYVLIANEVRLYLDEDKNLSDVIEGTEKIPVSDEVGKQTEGYYFSIRNAENTEFEYTIYLDEEENNTMPSYALKYNLADEENNVDVTKNLEDTGLAGARALYATTLPGKTTHNYTLKLWLGLQAENDAKYKTFSAKIRVEIKEKE